jgi:hypothetical protein
LVLEAEVEVEAQQVVLEVHLLSAPLSLPVEEVEAEETSALLALAALVAVNSTAAHLSLATVLQDKVMAVALYLMTAVKPKEPSLLLAAEALQLAEVTEQCLAEEMVVSALNA